MVNTADADKYLLFGDMLQIGSENDCGGPVTINVMCEEQCKKMTYTFIFEKHCKCICN